MAMTSNTSGNWLGGFLGNTTATTAVTTSGALSAAQNAQYGMQTIAYGQTYPQPVYYTPQVSVIPHNYPDKLHFQDSSGAVHSYSVEDVFRLLGLAW